MTESENQQHKSDTQNATAADAAKDSKKTRRRGNRRSKAVEEELLNVEESPKQEMEHDASQDMLGDRRFEQAFFGKLDPEIITYFKSIEHMLTKECIESKEQDERELFLQNIYDEVDGKELKLATDFGGSRILEKLMRISEPFHLRVLMDRMRGKYVQLMTHRFASHCIQTLLWLIPPHLEQELLSGVIPSAPTEVTPEGEKAEEDKLLSLVDLFLQMCLEMKSDVAVLMTDAYGSHILRSVLVLLSGVDISTDDKKQSLIKSKLSAKYAESKGLTQKLVPIPKNLLPDAFKNVLADIINDLATNLSDNDVQLLTTHTVASPAMQLLIIISKAPHVGIERGTELISRVLMNLDENSTQHLMRMVKDPVGSHLLQVIIQSAPTSLMKQLFNALFKGHLLDLSKDQIANYVVQTYLDTVQDPDQFQEIEKEMGGPDAIGRLLFGKRANVVLKYADLCLKYNSETFTTALKEAFKVTDATPKSRLIYLYLGLVPDSSDVPGYPNTTVPGSILVSKLMHFPQNQIQTLLNSVFAQSADTILNWCRNPSVSRAMESIFTSSTLTVKTKKAMVRMLQGKLADVAVDRFGSFLIEKCWDAADMQLKEIVVAELASKKTALEGILHGRKLIKMTRLDLFMRRKEDWTAAVKGVEKKKRLFEDIIGHDLASSVPQKKAKSVEVQQLAVPETQSDTNTAPVDTALNDVLNAIEAADIKPKKAKKKNKSKK